MHFEILVEGQSDKNALSPLMSKIIGEYRNPHTWNIHKHRDGIGTIQNDPTADPDRQNQSLLHNLPSKLRAYGKEQNAELVVVVLVDLDHRVDCLTFKNELVQLLDYCEIRPRTLFRIAIEELEAWYLGDENAIKLAYPNVSDEQFDRYIQDSQSGTWEMLADIVYSGGIDALLERGKRSRIVLDEKMQWATNISRCMDVEQNKSPSFCCFRDGLRRMAVEHNTQSSQ